MRHDSSTRLADRNIRDAEANLEEMIEHRRALGADLQGIADAIADHLTGQGTGQGTEWTEWTVVNRIELCLPRSCRDKLDALRASYGVPPLDEQLANQARARAGGSTLTTLRPTYWDDLTERDELCPATREAVAELWDIGFAECPICGAPASIHPSERRFTRASA